MNWAANRKINKTDEKTIKIALKIMTYKSKLSLRGKAINKAEEIIAIDASMKRRSYGKEKDEVKHWHDRLYLKVYNALERYNL